MRENRVIAGLLALGLLASAPAHAQDAVLEFTPSTPWAIDYGERSCALRREFTSEAGTAAMQMEAFHTPNLLDFVVVSTTVASGSGDIGVAIEPEDVAPDGRFMATLRLPPEFSGARFTTTLARNPAANPYDPEIADRTPDEYHAREREITGIALQNVFASPARLRTGSLASAMDALRTCLADLHLSWGIDESVNAAVVTPLGRSEEDTWFGQIAAAYPAEMVRLGKSARVLVNVMVGADGRVSACHAINLEPFPDFEQAACESLERFAIYVPARDADGNSVPATDALEIVYSLG